MEPAVTRAVCGQTQLCGHFYEVVINGSLNTLVVTALLWVCINPFMFLSAGLRQPAVLVPVLLWLLRRYHDWLLAIDLFQPLIYLCTSSYLWHNGQGCFCGDTYELARTLQKWSTFRGIFELFYGIHVCLFLPCLLSSDI